MLKVIRPETGEDHQVFDRIRRILRVPTVHQTSKKNLHHMIRFAVSYDNEAIVSTLSRQLSWSHFLDLIYIDDPLKQGFYTEMCRLERWSVRTLQVSITGEPVDFVALMYERVNMGIGGKRKEND